MGRLPKSLRFEVFNFLTVKETLKVAMTSKKVGAELEKSEIAKAGKEILIRLDISNYRDCLVCGPSSAYYWMAPFGNAFLHTDKVRIIVGKLCLFRKNKCKNPEHPNLELEVSKIIEQLPERFNNKKVSYERGHVCSRDGSQTIKINYDSMIDFIESERPDFVFDAFEFPSDDTRNTARIQDFLMRHSRRLTFRGSFNLKMFMTPATTSNSARPLERLNMTSRFTFEEHDNPREKFLLPKEINCFFNVN